MLRLHVFGGNTCSSQVSGGPNLQDGELEGGALLRDVREKGSLIRVFMDPFISYSIFVMCYTIDSNMG